MKKCIFLVLVSFIFLNSVFAKITFGSLYLNSKDDLLFSISNETTGINKYNALFSCKIENGTSKSTPKMLSFYPEKMELLENGEVLQIRNSYGTAKYYTSKNKFVCASTIKEIPEHPLPLISYASSYDGKWYCYLKQTSFVSADLILKKVNSDFEYVLSKNIQMDYEKVPVKWAKERDLLLYEKEGVVYFINPEAVERGVETDELYRKIGKGTINSVEFTDNKYIAYIDDSLLYRISIKGLYTMGLYAGIIGQGTVVGRLPFKFNAVTDKFSANSEVTSAVIIQNKRMFTYLTAHKNSSDYMDIIYSRPYNDSSASLVDSSLLWDRSGNPILWLEKLPYDGNKIRSSVYRLTTAAIQVLEIEDSGKPFISPDGTKVAFYAGAAIYVYDINRWNRICELPGEKIVNAIWSDSRTIYVGGEKSIRKWNILNSTTETLALSSVTAAYWSLDETTVIAENNSGNSYELDTVSNTWHKLGLAARRESSTQNGRYRVFLGTSTNCNYENAIYIRTLGKNPVTNPLYKESAKRKDNDKRVTLVFDAYDNADGLAQILSVLKKYNVKGEFFVNGEFVRRYPLETKQIVRNGYNCNSMFFSQTDLTENNFIIDESFIRRGLARNEDEFYACSNSELLPYWHAPFYKVNEDIIKYGKKAGYNYIDLKGESLDGEGKNPFQLIQEYYAMAVMNEGGLIPVTVGYSQYKNSDYLYNYLDLLICALIDGGFELVGINESLKIQ